MDKIDKKIISLIKEFLFCEKDYLEESFLRIKKISTNRRSSSYGFEWLIHTSLACFLLCKIDNQKTKEIEDLKIGEQDSDTTCKYDISFIVQGTERVIIEIKTTDEKAKFSFVKGDIKKEFPSRSIVYFLVFSYPLKNNTEIEWKIEGADLLETIKSPEEFKCFVLKKT